MTNNRLTPECHRLIAIEIASLDHEARKLEQLWGIGRLELLASSEFRLRFEQQRDLLNAALENDQVSREDILMQIGGMRRAWQAIDAHVRAAGHQPASPVVWEVQLEDGTVAMIVRDEADASQVAVQARERRAALYSLAEIGRLISGYPTLTKAKEAFPGAVITSVRHKTPTEEFLNDSIPF